MGHDQFKIKLSSSRSKAKLRRYFDTYPLLTSKFLDYRAWCDVDDIMISKQHYTTPGASQISILKLTMNDARVNFNWHHLDIFF
jgi:LAGLIDADG endonuclease